MKFSKIPYKIDISGPDSIKQLHQASIQMLSNYGALFENEKAISLLLSAGCNKLPNGRITIPETVIQEAIKSAPQQFTLFYRNGTEAMDLGGNNVYCGTGSDCPNVIDFETKQRRKCTIKDIEVFTRLSDALPNIDFILSMGLATDVPPKTVDFHHFKAMVENTTKPIFFTVVENPMMNHIIDFAGQIAGSMEYLKEKPFIAHFAMLA